MKSKKTRVSEKKKKSVEEIKNLFKKNRTLVICSIKNIPASLFQEIIKSLRNKAVVKVPKKRLALLALDELDENLKSKIDHSSAILFSDVEPYELSADLIKTKQSAKAKTGQIAPKDLIVERGPTDLAPGPAITELGNLGIEIQIEKGKINIKNPKIIVKKGEKITKEAADILTKLDIKPFLIGFLPIAALDKKQNKVYLEIYIDSEEAIKSIKEAYSKALSLSVEIGFANEESIKFLLSKAGLHEKALNSLIKVENNKELKEGEEKEEAQKTEEKVEQFAENKSGGIL